MSDRGIDTAKFLACIPHLSCQFSPFSLDSVRANSLERLRQRAHYKLRLEEALLSSYALGESHPDSCWMAFEVWAHPAITAFKCHSGESPWAGRRRISRPFAEFIPSTGLVDEEFD